MDKCTIIIVQCKERNTIIGFNLVTCVSVFPPSHLRRSHHSDASFLPSLLPPYTCHLLSPRSPTSTHTRSTVVLPLTTPLYPYKLYSLLFTSSSIIPITYSPPASLPVSSLSIHVLPYYTYVHPQALHLLQYYSLTTTSLYSTSTSNSLRQHHYSPDKISR